MKEIIMYNTVTLAQHEASNLKPNSDGWMFLKSLADKFNSGIQKQIKIEDTAIVYSIQTN